jgi:hypothetical protein
MGYGDIPMGWRVWNHLIILGWFGRRRNRACFGAGELIFRYSEAGEGKITLTLLRGIGIAFPRPEYMSCTKLDSSGLGSSRQAHGARQQLGFEPLFYSLFTDS